MDEPERSRDDERDCESFKISVKLSGPITIKVTGPALALILVLGLLVLTWILSH